MEGSNTKQQRNKEIISQGCQEFEAPCTGFDNLQRTGPFLSFPFLSRALDTGTFMALQGIPEKSPSDLSAKVLTDRSFKVLEVDNVCCFAGTGFLE